MVAVETMHMSNCLNINKMAFGQDPGYLSRRSNSRKESTGPQKLKTITSNANDSMSDQTYKFEKSGDK